MALFAAIAVAALVAALLITPLVVFTGADHSAYDTPAPTVRAGQESEAHRRVAAEIEAAMAGGPNRPDGEGLARMRAGLDARGAAAPIVSTVTAVEAEGVQGEWVLAPGADPDRRMLYIHGGGYIMGSPQSHRPIASRLSELTGAAVFVVRYRLMPEHPRLAGVSDCQGAYRWVLENGPRGRAAARMLVVAGDSAGGNLALATLAWARDTGLRRADAAVVFSPQTDATLASPSHRANLATDVMQRGGLGPAVTAARPLFLWLSYRMNGVSPRDPRLSPLFGDLSRLPPTLIQASAREMFLGDAVRYANKARAQGSPVTLQVWPHTLHAWQTLGLPESEEALAEAAAFLRALPVAQGAHAGD